MDKKRDGWAPAFRTRSADPRTTKMAMALPYAALQICGDDSVVAETTRQRQDGMDGTRQKKAEKGKLRLLPPVALCNAVPILPTKNGC
mmetsp:Transcript_26820/g.40651  ORF Transcript_26820/g.40651 Transcript_26820/m.40651 type:complete len:88 (-) Transcript_26820:211-474(-)